MIGLKTQAFSWIVVRDPRRVGKEMFDRHFRPGWWTRRIVQRDRVIERQLTVLNEQHYPSCGELLRDGHGRVFGLGRVRNASLAIRKSRRFPQQHLIAPRDQYDAGEPILASDRIYRL